MRIRLPRSILVCIMRILYINRTAEYINYFHMPEMTKANARQMLKRTLGRFREVTCQRVGVVFTWEGGLSVLGNTLFTKIVNQNSKDIWKALACPNDVDISIPAHEFEVVSSLEGDLAKVNVKSLRSMISWFTQKSLG